MPSPKALVVASLRSMAKACIREQLHLKIVRSAKRQLEADEKETLQRIRGVKARIDRELAVSASLLGIKPNPNE